MSELAPRMRVLHHKVQHLLAERERLVNDRKRADDELRDVKRSSSVLQARIMELEREIEVLRTQRPQNVVYERPVTKERIDELVSEIDRCLELLTN
jgi:chromosome segregation ATPase